MGPLEELAQPDEQRRLEAHDLRLVLQDGPRLLRAEDGLVELLDDAPVVRGDLRSQGADSCRVFLGETDVGAEILEHGALL